VFLSFANPVQTQGAATWLLIANILNCNTKNEQ